jgi:hypothetical protein
MAVVGRDVNVKAPPGRDYMTFWMMPAGDPDGNGIDDVLAMSALEDGFLRNEVHLIFGPVSGDVGAEDVALTIGNDPEYEGYYFTPDMDYGFGTVGDADGDGRDDLVVTAGGNVNGELAHWGGAPGVAGDTVYAQAATTYIRDPNADMPGGGQVPSASAH